MMFFGPPDVAPWLGHDIPLASDMTISIHPAWGRTIRSDLTSVQVVGEVALAACILPSMTHYFVAKEEKVGLVIRRRRQEQDMIQPGRMIRVEGLEVGLARVIEGQEADLGIRSVDSVAEILFDRCERKHGMPPPHFHAAERKEQDQV